jgi:hypothetical protein
LVLMQQLTKEASGRAYHGACACSELVSVFGLFVSVRVCPSVFRLCVCLRCLRPVGSSELRPLRDRLGFLEIYDRHKTHL